jgi:signal transduction histidine kinase
MALTVPVLGAAAQTRLTLTVFRAVPRPFERPTRDMLELFALHLAAALTTADLYTAAVQATREKARMLAHVAHEVAVPLHVILGTSELLGEHVDELGKACLPRLARQTRLLMAMVDNLLAFSRLEGAEPSLRMEPILVPELWGRVRELAAALVGDKDVRIEVRVESGAEWVASDPEKLERILANLATNAVKYTPHGRVDLYAAPENGQVRLAVRDTGIGIPPSEQERIFEPFYQGGEGRAHPAGVGLGLALAQDLARLLGTRIVVESREGAGATFSLTLPGAAETVRAAEQGRITYG